MELLIFFVGAVIWMVIKSLTQKPPQQPPARQEAPRTRMTERPNKSVRLSLPNEEVAPGDSYIMEQSDEAIELEGFEEFESGEQESTLSSASWAQGIVMVEILSPPRSKRPHRAQR